MTRKVFLVTVIILPWGVATVALPVIYFAPGYSDGRTLTNLFAGNIIALTAITLVVHPFTHWVFRWKIKDIAKSSCINRHITEEDLLVAKVLATTVLISLCIILFMAPNLVAFCFSLASCDECVLNHAFQSFWKYCLLLTSVCWMSNSLVYAWRLPLYRKSLKVLILKCASTDEHSPVNNHEQHFLQQMNRPSDLVYSSWSFSPSKMRPKLTGSIVFLYQRSCLNINAGKIRYLVRNLRNWWSYIVALTQEVMSINSSQQKEINGKDYLVLEDSAKLIWIGLNRYIRSCNGKLIKATNEARGN